MSQVVCCSHGGGLRVNDSHEMSFFICYFLKKQQKFKFSSTGCSVNRICSNSLDDGSQSKHIAQENVFSKQRLQHLSLAENMSKIGQTGHIIAQEHKKPLQRLTQRHIKRKSPL